MARYLLLLCNVVASAGVLAAFQRDPQSNSEPKTVLMCYRVEAERLHLTASSSELLNRIHVPAGTALEAVEVELIGPPCERAGEVVLYGHSSGLIAPRTEEPVVLGRLHKKHYGIETIRVLVDPLQRFVGGQAFVGVRNVPDSLRALLVRDTTFAACEDVAGSRQTAVYRGRDSAWLQTTLPMALRLEVKYPEHRKGGFVQDSTVDAAEDVNRWGQAYLSAGDVNGDGLIDIAAAGLLYVNSPSGFVVVDVSSDSVHPYVMFADVDGDGLDDLVTMELPCARSVSAWRWYNGLLSPLSVAAFPRGCVTPVSAVVLTQGQRPMMLISGYAHGHAVAMSVELGTTHTPVDVSAQLVVDDAVAPLLLAADVDGDNYVDVVTRSAVTDRIMRHVDRHEFVEIARTTFTAPVLDLSSGTYSHAQYGVGRLELPRSVSWLDNADETAYVTGSIVNDPRSNTIARAEERPASRQYADLDNDGMAELIEFGQGDCRCLVVFSWRDREWRDVTDEFGLSGVRGASDGLIVDLDMDGRLDLVVDRLGRVEVRYNRRECPQATSINILGAGPGTRMFTSKSEEIGSLVRGRGRLVEDAMQVHVLQPSVDSLVVELVRDGQTLRTRHAVARNRTVILGTGHESAQTTGRAGEPTMTYDGESLIVRGFRSGQPATLRVHTITGATVTERQVDQLTDGTQFPLHQLLVDLQAASGSYSVHIDGVAGVGTLMFTFVR